MLAVHLVQQSAAPLRILLFDRAGTVGDGIAYATPNARHLLNVRVANMSAYDSDPDHFVRWLARSEATGTPAPSGAFVSRGIYGRYLRSTLSECLATHSGSSVISIAAEVTGLQMEDGGVRLMAANGNDHLVDRAALCVGNFPPALAVIPKTTPQGAKRYIANPWSGALSQIAADDTVLIVGTGLTMVDVVIDLRSRGHRGRIVAVSRRGFLPLGHRDVGTYPSFLPADRLPQSVVALMRAVRREITAAAERGIDWRAVLDALRPQTQALWRALPTSERRKFLRHLRPYWEVHRHRIAPVVAAEIAALQRTGQLAVHAGRTAGVELTDTGVVLTLRCRGETRQPLEGDWLVNCSGPQLDYERIDDPLVRTMFDSGLAKPDPLSLGLDVSDDYRLVDRDGRSSDVLFALGPPIRGSLWETTAVPDIRKQCAALAIQLCEAWSRHPAA
jgi:uncharacterized NAD(P)/FAD-binding protein YdhS